MNELDQFLKQGGQYSNTDPNEEDDTIVTASGEILQRTASKNSRAPRGNSIDAYIRNGYACSVSDHSYISDESLRAFIKKLDTEKK